MSPERAIPALRAWLDDQMRAYMDKFMGDLTPEQYHRNKGRINGLLSARDKLNELRNEPTPENDE